MTRPRRVVGVSTKMYFSAARTHDYVRDLIRELLGSGDILSGVDIFIMPDFITLTSVVVQVAGTRIMCGAQDTWHEDFGAFTGEVSPAVLAEVGCRMVEVGHAERRRIFGETDEITARKAAAVVRNGMIPLVCIGERTRGDVRIAVDECQVQVEAVMAAVPADAEVMLAYEPVWAIGAAQPADPKHVVNVVGQIRGLDCVRNRAGTLRILYGGSAGPGLFENLKHAVDGLFLGRFGHDPAQMHRTIEEVASA
ncbi:putative triosephosphate isomerase [Diplogelasinospora grovesii]|uniref:Triosephosphate isomerase n=1 Tax=Diplogelasinospora grovesii TaxID=303347 RepID=A0AAN6N7C8_9PEZI|nr:putative triosephosphate isomerase [Diplogelasinospora grovesii]